MERNSDMAVSPPAVLTLPFDATPDPDDYVRAAMRWHFDAETGSKFWLRRRGTLGFDPITDVRTFADLTLFPNVADELRGVPIRDMVPQGWGPRPEIVSVIESGGTTGTPKRLPLHRHFADLLTAEDVARSERTGLSGAKDWMIMMPSGPHGAFEQGRRPAMVMGAVVYAIDFDPRWVKKTISSGDQAGATAYVSHLVDQAATILLEREVGHIRTTPPLLARLIERPELADRIAETVTHIIWGGAHMDAESRKFYREVLIPGVHLRGTYGTTMALGAGATERDGLEAGDPCVLDPYLSPSVSLRVVRPDTSEPVEIGERGQLVVNHVSASFLLPNNAERDEVTRIAPAVEQVGDSVADISPLSTFGGTDVVVGVY
jgi:phenylacetate-coenzyme A ligase PaaK-like adenylate-forming protein